MYKYLMFLFLAALPCISVAQPTNPATGLADVVTFVRRVAILNKIVSMEIETDVQSVKLISPKSISSNIDALVGSEENKKLRTLSLKYKEFLKAYFAGVSSFGEGDENLVLIEKTNLPYDFVNAGGLNFCQYGVFSTKAYNTLKLNSDQRAAAVARDILLPSLYNLGPLLKVTEIKSFSIIACYTAQDFSSSSIAGKDAETLAIVIPRLILKQYIESKITDNQVYKLATFYNVNTNTAGNVKKILIK